MPLLSADRSKELVALCRAGKLYEVEAWVAAGESLQVSAECKRTPLQIALESGFHSLVLLLARSEPNQAVKNSALATAVELHNLELIELLLAHGAEIRSVPLVDVLLTWEPAIIRLFLKGGANAISDLPFTEAFASKVRTALRPFMEYKDAHPELAADLQDQIDRALRHFCYEGELKWVSLLLWAGANPRNAGAKLTEPDEPEERQTALELAAYHKDATLLKRLKPTREDDLSALLRRAAVVACKESLHYLLERGAKPNDKANGGSQAVDSCLWHIHVDGFSLWHNHRDTSSLAIRGTLEALRTLLQKGALWRPNDRKDMNSVRRILLGCEPDAIIELLKLLTEDKACSDETLEELFSKRMREHMVQKLWWMSHLKLRHLVQPKPSLRKRQVRIVPKYFADRYNREELYDKVWKQPMTQLAKAQGISDVGMAKIFRKLYIPVPGRGYWAWKAAGGKGGPRPPLPPVQVV